jgi:membrane-associated HD superfamily phosphohydrolase
MTSSSSISHPQQEEQYLTTSTSTPTTTAASHPVLVPVGVAVHRDNGDKQQQQQQQHQHREDGVRRVLRMTIPVATRPDAAGYGLRGRVDVLTSTTVTVDINLTSSKLPTTVLLKKVVSKSDAIAANVKVDEEENDAEELTTAVVEVTTDVLPNLPLTVWTEFYHHVHIAVIKNNSESWLLFCIFTIMIIGLVLILIFVDNQHTETMWRTVSVAVIVCVIVVTAIIHHSIRNHRIEIAVRQCQPSFVEVGYQLRLHWKRIGFLALIEIWGGPTSTEPTSLCPSHSQIHHQQHHNHSNNNQM